MRFSLFIASSLVLLLAACGTNGASSGSATQVALSSDMTGALALTTKFESSSSLAFAAAPARRLKKIKADGSLADILNLERDISYQVTTPTHVIVAGQFSPVLAADGSSINCYLIAFPKSGTADNVSCLSQTAVGTYSPYSMEISAFNDDPGIAIKGSTVYFVTGFNGGRTKLMKWEASSPTVSTMIDINYNLSESGFDNVYVSQNQQNICATRPGIGPFKGSITCGAINGTTFANLDLGSALLPSNAIRVGNRLVTLNQTIDFDSLTVTPTIATFVQLPMSKAMMVEVSGSAVIAIESGTGKLVRIDDTGTVTTIDASTNWSKIRGNGTYLYVYGGSGSMLKRMGYADSSLVATNYLSSYNMLSVESFSVSFDGHTDLLRIDGTASSGSRATVYINATSGAIHSASSQLPSLDLVTPL